MNKDFVAQQLLKMFTPSSVFAWLSKFPDNHVFDIDYVDNYIGFINALPPIPMHPDEL